MPTRINKRVPMSTRIIKHGKESELLASWQLQNNDMSVCKFKSEAYDIYRNVSYSEVHWINRECLYEIIVCKPTCVEGK